MRRVWALLTLVVTLTGCGVAGTGASAAAGAAAEAQQAAQAKQTEDQVRQQIGAAEQQASDQRHAAEAAAQ
jgi:hypothetical protein